MSKKHPNKLSSYRKHHQVKQIDMKYLCDKENSISLSRYEQGEYFPDIQTLMTYSIAFNIPIKDLIPDYYAEICRKLKLRATSLLEHLGNDHFTYSKFKRKSFLDNLLERISCLKEVHDTPNTQKEDHSSGISSR